MGGPSCRKGESPVTSTSAAQVIQTTSLLAHASPPESLGPPQWGQQPSCHPWLFPPFPLRLVFSYSLLTTSHTLSLVPGPVLPGVGTGPALAVQDPQNADL